MPIVIKADSVPKAVHSLMSNGLTSQSSFQAWTRNMAKEGGKEGGLDTYVHDSAITRVLRALFSSSLWQKPSCHHVPTPSEYDSRRSHHVHGMELCFAQLWIHFGGSKRATIFIFGSGFMLRLNEVVIYQTLHTRVLLDPRTMGFTSLKQRKTLDSRWGLIELF